MKKLLLLVFSLMTFHLLVAQSDMDDYSSEVTWGINKNTNGGVLGGFVLKIGKYKKDNVYATYGLEMVNVRHPNELKRQALSSGTLFIWGKENYLYAIRTQYGREVVRFKKAPQQGVQISTVVAGGPTIGVVSPYYLLYNGKYQPYAEVKDNISLSAVQGAGKSFQGLSSASIVPGINTKAGVTFEFGTFRDNVAGVELGVSLEAYPKKIVIIPTQDNKAVFLALYASMYWGTRR